MGRDYRAYQVMNGQRVLLEAVLQKASEDFAGLWEIPIVLRSLGVANPVSTAQSVVRHLLEDGLVGCVWGNPHPEANLELTIEECVTAVSDEKFWREDVPFEGRTLWLYATPRGEKWIAKSTSK